jgi:ATP-binding cassette, subfamily B, bacterial
VSATLTYLRLRLNKLGVQLRYLPRTLAIVWEVSGSLTLLWGVLLVAQGVLPVATVYLTRAIVNSLVAAVRSGGEWSTIRPTLILSAWMGAVMLATQLLRSLTIWVRTAQSERVRDHIAGLIQKKSLEVDLAFYDSSDFYDHLHRARTEAAYRPVQLIEGLGTLVQNGITVLAMIAILIPFGPILPLTIVISTLPALYVVLRAGLRRHEWSKRITVDNRRAWYYDTLLTAPESAPEMRLFDLGGHFTAGFRELRRRLRDEQLKIARQQGISELWAGLAALVTTGGAMAWTGSCTHTARKPRTALREQPLPWKPLRVPGTEAAGHHAADSAGSADRDLRGHRIRECHLPLSGYRAARAAQLLDAHQARPARRTRWPQWRR